MECHESLLRMEPKVYRNKAGILKVVTTCMGVLDALLMDTARYVPESAATEKKSERIITIETQAGGSLY
jgi:hypothetical protein